MSNIERKVVDGLTVEYGHTLKEYMRKYGDEYDTGDLWDFSKEIFSDDELKQPNIVYWCIVDDDGEERFYETREEIKESCKETNEEVLDEGTSNFPYRSEFPLLVFYTYDEFLYNMTNDPDYPQEEQFENERDNGDFYIDWDAFENAKDAFEQKYWDENEICVLTEDDQERLESKLDDFNDETNNIANNLYDADNDDDYYALKDIELKIEAGYYEAAYIDVDGEDQFNYMSEDVAKEQRERFNNFFKELKNEFGLTQLGLAYHASNGETGFNIIKDESLEEKKKKKEPFVKVGTGFDLAKDTAMTNHMLGSDCCEDLDSLDSILKELKNAINNKDASKEKSLRSALRRLGMDDATQDALLNEDFDEYDTDSYYNEDDICVYQFPQATNERDIAKAKEYGLEYLGIVNDLGFQPGDKLIKGKYKDLKRYCDEYLDYVMHPYYLYKEEDIDLEDILEPANECLKEEKEYDGKCPFCGSENIDFVDSDEDSEKHVCHDCGQDFLVHDDGHVTTRNNRPIEESCSDKELIDKLVAFGTCDSEEEAKKRVAKMSQEMKDEMCKSLKRQAQDHLLNDSLNESNEVARVEYCVMDKNNNNIACFDNTDDAIAFAKDNEGIRVLEVQYGPKDEHDDEPELGAEEVWSIRESLDESNKKYALVVNGEWYSTYDSYEKAQKAQERFLDAIDNDEDAQKEYGAFANVEIKEVNESLNESMKSEVTKWWKDVEDANKEMKWEFNIDNGDYSDAEAMHAAMFDMLDDLKEKGASELFNSGKKIYNKYALSKYNESLNEALRRYKIEYWVDEDARDQGLGDIAIETFDDLEAAKEYADKLFDDVASVEVLDTQDSDNVVYGRYPEDESMNESKEDKDRKRLKYLLDKEDCCTLDKGERFELQDLIQKYGYPENESISEGGPGSGDHRDATQRYNDRLHATFRRFDEMNDKMAKFLLDHGVSSEEVEELKKNTGLHGNALHQKLVDLELDDEFFERKQESCKESINAWSIKNNVESDEIEVLVKKNDVWETIASIENCPTKNMLKEDIIKEYSKVAKQVIKESGYKIMENDDLYALHVKVLDSNSGRVMKVERLMTGSRKECVEKKKQLEETSPEDSNHNRNVYKVSKVK